MRLRQARKIMRKYYRTGIRPREATFVKAFNRTKVSGCCLVRPYNVLRSFEKIEALHVLPILPDALLIQKFLNQVYEHLMRKMFPAAPIQIPNEEP